MNVVAGIKGFAFRKNLPLLNQTASLGFDVTTAPPAVLAVLDEDNPPKPFAAGDVDLVDTKLTASTQKPIEFARGADKVSFSANANAFAGLGVYRTGAALIKKLGDTDDFSLDPLEFGLDKDSLLCVIRWGYGAEAKGSGAIALGAIGKATLDIAGSGDGLFAVIRRLPSSMPARDVVQTVADSWMLPRQVASIDQVEPGTWLIAETAGSFSINLGAQVGYDFNWVQAAKLGGLTGDIGLRLQIGINAAVGFSSSGRCAVVISRDSSEKSLRLRFFRLKTRELDLSFNASLGIQVKPDTLLPGQVDDFISAVFGTHGQQILRDLTVLEKWTKPTDKLSDLLANAGIEGAEALVARLAGVTPAQLQDQFDAVHAKAVSFITQWHALPHVVGSTVLKLVEEQVDLADVRDIVKRLTTITADDLASLLDTELNRIDFFHTPVGRLLESMADEGVLSLLGKLEDVKKISTQVLAILDGSTLEDTLKTFQSFVEKELGLDRVLKVVNDSDFDALDKLLKKKLADFLGQHVLVLQDLDKVRKTIGLLLQKRSEYYEKALEALHRKYNFSLNAASQTTTTDTALFDATFDFSQDPASVIDFFRQALEGRLDDLLAIQPRQVTIAAGRITHGVKRQTHVDVSLPFMDMTESHVNEALASVEAHEGGLLFGVKASDTVTSSNRRKSSLSLTMGLAQSKDTGVRLHQTSLEMNYSLLFAKRNMKVEHVRAQVGPAIRTFFKKQVASLDTFVSVLDRRTEDAIPNGANLLGNGLLALDISVSPEAAAIAGRAWLDLPTDLKADIYSKLSIAIQISLKQNIHDSVFNSPDGYADIGDNRAQTFLAYCALAPRAQKDMDWFWNWPDIAERRTTLANPQTLARMRTSLARAQEVLIGSSLANSFKPERVVEILGSINPSDPFLNTLLASENEVVKDALRAGVGIAVAARSALLSDAVRALEAFGSTLTQAFNADITRLLGAGIQSLGTRVFLDASRAIANMPIAETNAILNLEFLKPDAKFDDATLLAAGHVPAEALAFADRVVDIA